MRAAATHFPRLRRLVCLLYKAIRQHRLLESIDIALCAGNFEKLSKLCGISHCKLFSSDSNEDSCGTADSEDAVDQPIRLQQPNLPDLESHLHVEHAELIADVGHFLADDAQFPCYSCELLIQRKQVTAFNFSDTRFFSDIWIKLKTHRRVIQRPICRRITCVNTVGLFLNKNNMPCRCILNSLITEPVPKELQVLDPLSKQLIQRGKAFQAIFRLGTYTGKVPNYNALKACKGTMLFLPLPLQKTLQTIDEMQSNKSCEGLAGLPDPELYIIVNGKPSKNKILWQSVVNVEHVKAAVQKLKEIQLAVC